MLKGLFPFKNSGVLYPEFRYFLLKRFFLLRKPESTLFDFPVSRLKLASLAVKLLYKRLHLLDGAVFAPELALKLVALGLESPDSRPHLFHPGLRVRAVLRVFNRAYLAAPKKFLDPRPAGLKRVHLLSERPAGGLQFSYAGQKGLRLLLELLDFPLSLKHSRQGFSARNGSVGIDVVSLEGGEARPVSRPALKPYGFPQIGSDVNYLQHRVNKALLYHFHFKEAVEGSSIRLAVSVGPAVSVASAVCREPLGCRYEGSPSRVKLPQKLNRRDRLRAPFHHYPVEFFPEGRLNRSFVVSRNGNEIGNDPQHAPLLALEHEPARGVRKPFVVALYSVKGLNPGDAVFFSAFKTPQFAEFLLMFDPEVVKTRIYLFLFPGGRGEFVLYFRFPDAKRGEPSLALEFFKSQSGGLSLKRLFFLGEILKLL